MSYLVIARKYRPQIFNDVIGQEHIARTLRNAIKLDKISHAYLFSGPRGVGKTTTARIFAKAVNCMDRKNEDPCNKCASCNEITKSESMDVIEIDAASNRGIEEIRRLRENIKFAPIGGKYKVYIIDEVHMLTKEAFNAILKTLEEPPPHVIFIMATTELEKVLDTITSRCQSFNFRLIPEKFIMENLQEILKKENVECDEEGLWLITRAGAGSVRDAQSIMDQVISYSDGNITAEDVTEILGLIPRDILFSYTDYIKTRNIKDALELTNKLFRDGYNLNTLFNDMLMHFRNMMFAKVFGPATGFLGIGKEYSDKLSESAGDFSKEQLVWIIEFLSRNIPRIKYADNQHIVMDTILFKLCQKYVSFEDIMEIVEKGGGVIADEPAISGNSVSAGHSIPDKKSEKTPDEHPKRVAKELKADVKKPSSGGKWEQILEQLNKRSQPLYHSLKESTAVLKGKEIKITYTGNLDMTERQNNILKETVKDIMGEGFYLNVIREGKEYAVSEEENNNENTDKEFATPAQIEQDEPVVGTIVNLFKGRIEKE
ncbi:MAG: DNA polymerase III subunit gamma/tau [Elusimicrobiota bacterium]